jgi:hypothetical protein
MIPFDDTKNGVKSHRWGFAALSPISSKHFRPISLEYILLPGTDERMLKMQSTTRKLVNHGGSCMTSEYMWLDRFITVFK